MLHATLSESHTLWVKYEVATCINEVDYSHLAVVQSTGFFGEGIATPHLVCIQDNKVIDALPPLSFNLPIELKDDGE